ncbi:uncharacterized protein TNCV_4982901 [Trichonephila clavipes]|uniref:Uncharacterized protein n=1 Tax=Trichonephila clavipes TaxID=2585209 RepID=A0A8X6WFI8_TRICX|nr:uncharacterized protein TNCV_4982901 [Trichonephila clavipes]
MNDLLKNRCPRRDRGGCHRGGGRERVRQLQGLPQLKNGGGIGVPVRKERKDTRGHDKRGRTLGGASLLSDSPETTPPPFPATSWTSIIIRTSLPDGPQGSSDGPLVRRNRHCHHSPGYPGAPEQQPPVHLNPRALRAIFAPGMPGYPHVHHVLRRRSGFRPGRVLRPLR